MFLIFLFIPVHEMSPSSTFMNFYRYTSGDERRGKGKKGEEETGRPGDREREREESEEREREQMLALTASAH